MPAPSSSGSAGGRSPDLFGRGMLYVLIWSMQLIVATLVSPVLAHLMPIEEFGAYAAALALYQLLILMSVWGLDQALEMQRVEDGTDGARSRSLLTAGIGLAWAMAALAAVTSPLWAGALGFEDSGLLVTITLLWAAPGAAVLMILGLLQAEDRLKRFATVSLLSTVGSQACGMALVLATESTAVTYAWGNVIGQTTALVLGLAWTRPRLRGALDRAMLRRALALGIPLALTALSHFALNAGDRFLIQRWMGEVEVARYQVAFTVGNAMALVLGLTNRAWLPRIKAVADPDARWRLIASSRDGTYWLTGWCLLGITIGAPALLRIVAPASYRPDSLTIVVFVIALGAVPFGASMANSRMLTTIRVSAPMAWASGLALAVKVIATVLLLPWLGLAGAALGTLIGLWAQSWWLRAAVSRHHVPVPSNRSALAFVAGACLLAGLSTLLPQTEGWNVARFLVGAACAVPLLVSLRALRSGRTPFAHGSSEAEEPSTPETESLPARPVG